MTEKANPSINRPITPFETATAIAYGGHVLDGKVGFVVPAAEPTEASIQDQSVDESNLDAFSESSDSTSLLVTIRGGEAFVHGAWIVKDDNTGISLDASTNGQTVYVGWNKDTSDDVILGTIDAFESQPSDTDVKIPLWTFDTDGSGVTSVTDERQIGKPGSIDITAGTGLTGGGEVSLGESTSLDVDGVPNSSLSNNSVTVNAGTGLTGGGSISLGSSSTLDVDGVPNSSLDNDSITINARTNLLGGGQVALGDTVTIDVEDGAGSGLDADTLDGLQGSAYATDTELSNHVNDTSNPHSVAADQLTGPWFATGDDWNHDGRRVVVSKTGAVTVDYKGDHGKVNSGSPLHEQNDRVATRDWVNNNADVPNADFADSAGDADTVDGHDAADLGSDMSMLVENDSAPSGNNGVFNTINPNNPAILVNARIRIGNPSAFETSGNITVYFDDGSSSSVGFSRDGSFEGGQTNTYGMYDFPNATGNYVTKVEFSANDQADGDSVNCSVGLFEFY